jgi:hypothetical protein
VHGDAPTKLAHDLRCSFATAALGQIQRTPLTSRGHEGRGQGGRLPSGNARGHHAQQGGEASKPCQIPVPVLGSSPRLAHRRCTSTCGLTMSIHSPEDLLAQSERLLTKEARGLPVAVMGAKRASTPSMRT